jgi:hypothetical protein
MRPFVQQNSFFIASFASVKVICWISLLDRKKRNCRFLATIWDRDVIANNLVLKMSMELYEKRHRSADKTGEVFGFTNDFLTLKYEKKIP